MQSPKFLKVISVLSLLIGTADAADKVTVQDVKARLRRGTSEPWSIYAWESDEVIQALAKYPGDIDFKFLDSLSDKAAAALGKHQGTLTFSWLRGISDEAAASLASHQGRLLFPKLEKLTSEPLAKQLARQKGSVDLEAVKVISPAAANAVAGNAESQEDELILDGLQELPADVAKALSRFGGRLYLKGLKTISDEAAAELAKKKDGKIIIPNLTALTSGALAKTLVEQDMLRTTDLTTLSPEAAKEIARDKGFLNLSNLQELSDASAEALSHHQGQCNLSGLKKLSVGAAKALAKYKARLELDDKIEITDEVEEILRSNKMIWFQ